MIKLNYDKFNDFIEVFERRCNLWLLDSDSLFEKLNGKLNEKNIRNELKKIIKDNNEKETIKVQNSQISTFSNALINYLSDETKMIQGYTTLTKFCKNKDFRPSNIKQLLQDKGYLIKHNATEKSFLTCNLYVTIKHHIKKSGAIDKLDLIFLWKENFLNDLVSRNKDAIIDYELDYKYRTPRSLRENLNEINKYAKPLYDSEFIGTDEFESADYCGEYPYMDLIKRMIGYEMSSSGFKSFYKLLIEGITYKEKLITNPVLLERFSIQKNMLFRYLENYEKHYI